MIKLTSLNGKNQFYLNVDKIEIVEATPDTIITLDTGRKYLVAESVEDVVRGIESAKRRSYSVIERAGGWNEPYPSESAEY